jgi:hypothetical protein
MRVNGEGKALGGFYVPKDYHLRLLIAERYHGGGWCSTDASCPGTACVDAGRSIWFTRADGYNYPDRNPLLLIEPNVNAFRDSFEDGTIWFDVSGVDGINANMGLYYGTGTNKINRSFTSPLMESKTLKSNIFLQ